MDSDQFKAGDHVELVLKSGQKVFGDISGVSTWGEPSIELLTVRHISTSEIREATFGYGISSATATLLAGRKREAWLGTWLGRNRHGLTAAALAFALVGAYWLGHRPVAGLEARLSNREAAVAESEVQRNTQLIRIADLYGRAEANVTAGLRHSVAELVDSAYYVGVFDTCREFLTQDACAARYDTYFQDFHSTTLIPGRPMGWAWKKAVAIEEDLLREFLHPIRNGICAGTIPRDSELRYFCDA